MASQPPEDGNKIYGMPSNKVLFIYAGPFPIVNNHGHWAAQAATMLFARDGAMAGIGDLRQATEVGSWLAPPAAGYFSLGKVIPGKKSYVSMWFCDFHMISCDMNMVLEVTILLPCLVGIVPSRAACVTREMGIALMATFFCGRWSQTTQNLGHPIFRPTHIAHFRLGAQKRCRVDSMARNDPIFHFHLALPKPSS